MQNTARRLDKGALPSLPPGTPLQITLGHATVSLPGLIVGYEESKYLVVALTASGLRHALFLRGGGAFVQAEYQGARYEFHSPLLGSARKPQRLLFLGFPSSVRCLDLRAHRRLPCTLMCRVRTEEGARQAVITNLSLGGCGLSLPMTDRETPPIVGGAIIDLDVRGPERAITLTGLARSLTLEEKRLEAGLQFLALPPGTKKELARLVANLGG